ncbi:MAG: hypothetical protein V1838_02090 [Patescibacteria group bacterium]
MKCRDCQLRKKGSGGQYCCGAEHFAANGCPYGKTEPDKTLNDEPGEAGRRDYSCWCRGSVSGRTLPRP